MSAAPHPSRFRVVVRNVWPWAVALAALVWVLSKVHFTETAPGRHDGLVDVFRHAPLAPLLAVSVLLLVANMCADCLAMYFTFRWLGSRVPYRELIVIRAATYLLAVIQYYVGQAAIIAYLHKRTGVRVLRASGFILFISGINMAVLLLLASFGLATSNMPVPWLRWLPLAVGAGAALYVAVLVLKPSPVAEWPLLAPLFEMGVVGHLKAIAIRVPHVLVIIVWHYLGLRLFGVNVPALTALVFLPAVFFVTALPISPSGLGTTQAVAVYFFAQYAPREAAEHVVAYSLALTAISMGVMFVLGFLALPSAKRLGVSDAEAAAPEPAAPIAAMESGDV